MKQIGPGERPLLVEDDMHVPLDADQLIDSRAILFMAGHEANSSEITAFAYFHRQRLNALVKHPAVDSDLMIDELFGTLPEQIDEGLLPRLVDEVNAYSTNGLAATAQPTQQAISSPKQGMAMAKVPQYTGVAPVQRRARFQQEKLFYSHAAAINSTPSQELVSKAEKFLNANDNMYNKFFAHIMRFVRERDVRHGRKLLIAAGVAEILIELPIVIGVHATYRNIAEKRFIKAMGREYPHLRKPDNVLPGVESLAGLRGGDARMYAQLLLQPEEHYPQPVNEDEPPSNDQPKIVETTRSHSRPATNKRLTPIVGTAD